MSTNDALCRSSIATNMGFSRDSTIVSRRRLDSLLFATLIFFAIGAQAAVDEDAITAIDSAERNFRDLDTEAHERHEVQGSNSLVQAMRAEIDSAKRLATLARLNKRPRLLKELWFRIKDSEEAIGGSVVDADLPKSAPKKMTVLRQVFTRATQWHRKCDDRVRRLRSLVAVNENTVTALQEENNFLGRLAARTMPKGLHCLALQLTIQYYQQFGEGSRITEETNLYSGGLLHYTVYTENVLAATAIVNSTLYFAKEPHRHVFHVLTSGLNYAAMRMWFTIYPQRAGGVEVTNLDSWNGSDVSWALLEGGKKYLKPVTSSAYLKQDENFEMRTQIGLYMILPRVFPKLDKLVVLDEDVVVRKDLTHLWEVDLHNKAIGSVRLNSNREATNDWSCINIVDLGNWRGQRLTEMYEESILNAEDGTWDEISSLHKKNTHMLNDSACFVLELDDTPSELENDTQSAAAIRYGGYAKPWLGMGMGRHRSMWTRFVDYENPHLQACNINK